MRPKMNITKGKWGRSRSIKLSIPMVEILRLFYSFSNLTDTEALEEKKRFSI